MRQWVLLLLFFWCPVSFADDLLSLAKEIEAQEKAVPKLNYELRKEIIFADAPVITDLSIVYLHGFSASRMEVFPLVENLAKSLKANLFFQRFKGHAVRDKNAFRDITLSDWQRDTQEALSIGRRLGKTVIVIATSTGAPLAVSELAKDKTYPAEAIILLSPNFRLKSSAASLLAVPVIGDILRDIVFGRYRSVTVKNPRYGMYWQTLYNSAILKDVQLATQLVSKQLMSNFSFPTLVAVHPEDVVVDAQTTQAYFNVLPSAKKVLLKAFCANDRHIIAGDIMSPSSTEFLQRTFIEFIRNKAVSTDSCNGSAN